ncbi:TPA: glycosyltransferase family 2 protein [Klebsiella oxytoca]|uniref:glycosyltransferase family 2 protein n=1 Tax=Klebsiella oxytoca TaxID=571 RepID=UPI00191FE88E|nr:glycosyltransferase [Klebsiella oxytoca]MBL0806023.1 glycosyltransferase [Klebsiella oxytoca]HBM2883478.1 glycosyltransferase [Klebsiella oxytoca]HCK0929909.1 glycosyltransferase [Klebsiella oxytoca]HDS6518843.1 glycosyltransferase [Klebsiella oxytoca]HDT4988304.1 glycosyltransferase [Klebsiella oxytoca]
MDISVVIPCYNRETSIAGAVLSVLNQVGNHNIEVIVVDDGSTDGSIDRIKGFNVKVLHTNGRTGACNARNIGIAAAQNEWVAFNDSDDFWRIDKLNYIEEIINSNDINLDYIFHPFIRVAGLKSIIGGIYHRTSGNIKDDFLKKMLACNMISTQCLISKKDALIECGYFDVHLKRFQDWELALRIANKFQGFYIAEPLSLCIESSDSISKGFKKGIAAREYIFNKHRSLYLSNKSSMYKFLFSLQLRKIVSLLKRD